MGILFCHLRIIYPACAGGSTWQLQDVKRCTFIFPACAGVNPAPPVLSKGISDSPRMRGGHPNFGCWKSKNTQFTPHARGSTHETDTVNSDGIIHPACAGVNLTCRCSGCMMMHSPRMCGGQPDFVVDAYTTLFFPCICRDVASLLHKIAWRKSHERFYQQTTNHSEDIRFG